MILQSAIGDLGDQDELILPPIRSLSLIPALYAHLPSYGSVVAGYGVCLEWSFRAIRLQEEAGYIGLETWSDLLLEEAP